MPNSISVFDNKFFNGEVFQGYVERIPNPKRTELINSRAIRPRPELATAMADQDGGNYITTALRGLINTGKPQNYDGATDIEAKTTTTFKHSRVVVGRSDAWTENDFSHDITGGQDFIENIAEQISEYWNEVDQATIISILKGVFSMTDTEGAKFVDAHTYDISGNTGEAALVDATTLNTAIQRACGDNKRKFSLVIMHSTVSTHLENLQLLQYLKYTDRQGIQRDLALGTLNGKTVLIDDGMPAVETGDGKVVYTTYILGEGAIEYTDCGAKVPYEVDRDPKTNGGQDTLYSRQRKCFAPYGISFTMASMASNSPTDAELEMGANWELVSSASADGKEYIAHKTIPIAQILSLG